MRNPCGPIGRFFIANQMFRVIRPCEWVGKGKKSAWQEADGMTWGDSLPSGNARVDCLWREGSPHGHLKKKEDQLCPTLLSGKSYCDEPEFVDLRTHWTQSFHSGAFYIRMSRQAVLSSACVKAVQNREIDDLWELPKVVTKRLSTSSSVACLYSFIVWGWR